MLTNAKPFTPIRSEPVSTQRAVSQPEPNAIYAEQVLLGVLLGCPDTIDSVVSMLDIEDFYAPQHREIYATLVSLAGSGGVLNYIAVQDRLRQTNSLEKAGGDHYLSELITSTPGSADSVSANKTAHASGLFYWAAASPLHGSITPHAVMITPTIRNDSRLKSQRSSRCNRP